MILEAFWKGDRDALGWLTEADVANAFVEAIDARAAAGHTLENRLVSIERAVITNAPLQGRSAQIKVRFAADIAGLPPDPAGQGEVGRGACGARQEQDGR